MLFEVFTPKSMLDIGCGLGTWLSVAREMGVQDVNGIDGAWLDKTRLRVPGILLYNNVEVVVVDIFRRLRF
jgi:hypothetical protein